MSFPKPNIPEYVVEVVSTKKKHKIRPYTCGEQEALLLALETSGEMDVIANACEKIVESGTNNIDIQELPSFDFEYFLRNQFKSIDNADPSIMIVCGSLPFLFGFIVFNIPLVNATNCSSEN